MLEKQLKVRTVMHSCYNLRYALEMKLLVFTHIIFNKTFEKPSSSCAIAILPKIV
ncbi:hypothetical protein Lgra_1581 [Legionella gratiana]|uniref:Uncharacterized protein n=1 Tax=Legionella gratiana TaxID=45066 RepID=A0A378J7D3_9GAMM|nr:hypothetical protein Lgra_1581 [Legionella gratiana]STX43535.1 Uncharacterised protein [Legionella gratiana]